MRDVNLEKLYQARVLVLGGDTRAALAVVRSLGRAGLEVAVAESCSALASKSRYISKTFRSPDPSIDPENYKNWLVATVTEYCPALLLPVTDLTLMLTLQLENELRRLTNIPTIDLAKFDLIEDKFSLVERAAKVGIKVPKTILIPGNTNRTDALLAALQDFTFPAVLKPRVSAANTKEGYLKLGALYPKSVSEVLEIVEGKRELFYKGVPLLLQERIEGVGIGVFALCKNGKTLTTFCHQRLLEKPPTGGVSVLSMSIPESEAPVSEAKALLAELDYQGVGMVEFKRTAGGECYLMEINPRFWGSLQLAIDSGRDFPLLLATLALLSQNEIEEIFCALPPYLVGQRLRWFLGTVDHALIRLKTEKFSAFAGMLLRNQLLVFNSWQKTKLETFRKDDPRPAAYEICSWIAGGYLSRAKKLSALGPAFQLFLE